MHAVWTSQIAIFLHFIDKCSYNLQEIIKFSYIYSKIFENPKVAGLQLKILSKLYFSTILPNFLKQNLFRIPYSSL